MVQVEGEDQKRPAANHKKLKKISKIVSHFLVLD